MGVRQEITGFVESAVLPLYSNFDAGHRQDHARSVIESALYLCQFYDVDPEIIYVAAACHDLGLSVGRETHHLESGRIIRQMSELRRWFSEEQIETIAQAAEDHRASASHEPRSIYGRIIAEADRQLDPETVVRRAYQYGKANYPELDEEAQWQRVLQHLQEKYAEGGYLRLWIPESPNAARLATLRAIINDPEKIRNIRESFA